MVADLSNLNILSRVLMIRSGFLRTRMMSIIIYQAIHLFFTEPCVKESNLK